MKYVGTATAFGLLASSSLVHASGTDLIPGTFTGNIGFVSEYAYQAITYTSGNPAIQGGFDWDVGNSWYVSMWGSNVDYYDADTAFVTNSISGGNPTANQSNVRTINTDDNAALELDFYVGYYGYIGGGYNTPYDVGIGYYLYPTARHDAITYRSEPGAIASGKTAVYKAYGTEAYPDLYVGVGHWFFDDRMKTMAYISYTNDYNGQNVEGWSLYDDTEFYLPYAVTLRFHAGYTWGPYWQQNFFSYNSNSHLVGPSRSWGFCGGSYAAGEHEQYALGSAKNTSRYNDCVAGSGDDNDFFDWGIGLSRSFGQFDLTLDYVWATGIENEDEVKSWWSGMDQDGANEIYTDGKLIAGVKMTL